MAKQYHRTRDEIERDRARISELLLQSTPVREIARILNEEAQYSPPLGHSTFHADIQAIREEWRTETHGNIEALHAEELARLAHVEREAFSAWRESQNEGSGDPRFLALVLTSSKQRTALLGLDDPQRREAEKGDDGKINLIVRLATPEDARAESLGESNQSAGAETEVEDELV